MSGPATLDPTIVTDKRQLAEWLAEGCKPKDEWRVGTEHEKFVFDLADLRTVPYEGPRGIRTILEGLRDETGWAPLMEGENLIGLKGEGASISLEPGGQLELSGAPLKSLHQTCAEVNRHLALCRKVADRLGLGMLGLGYNPKWPVDEIPHMPKARYGIMRAYMERIQTQGQKMMHNTCTIQANLDFASEADMVLKYRVSLALQPVAMALFANSPFANGKPSDYVSWRGHLWTDTDPDRSGAPEFVFEDGMGFERYVDYMLDVPMYFVSRGDTLIDASGQSFRDFMAGKLPALPGERPTLGDWENHLSTAFPDVRLKRFLEMRAADGGPWKRICALPAFWVGLLYDQTSLEAAWDLCRNWTPEERAFFTEEAPRVGLQAQIGGTTLQEVAEEALLIAENGLKARGLRDNWGDDETQYLRDLKHIAETGHSTADEMLHRYKTEWNGSVDPVFSEMAF
ncbi:MAG: glutamate--cysteine ligase [Alphaproteobacteria bacterium]